MPTYGVTNSGFSLPLLEDVLDDTITKFKTQIPSLDFADFSVENDLASIMASSITDMYGSLYDVYVSQNPRFAFGCKLDILANRNGLSRITDETDEELQERIIAITSGSGALSGSSCFDALYNDLIEINGVTEVQINLNDTSKNVGGLPPNSYEVMVLGGNDEEVAEAIWNKHPAGITLSGNSSVRITDCRGVCREINFTRPRFVPIFLDFRIRRTSVNCGCPTDNTDIVKDAIANHLNTSNGICFTRIGQPVNVQDFFKPIYEIQGLGINCAKASRDGLVADKNIIELRRDEVPYYTIDCINVEFTPEEQTPCETGIYLEAPENCGFKLDLQRTASISEFNSVGAIISYQYTVTNTGLVAITNPILISDDVVSVTCDSIGSGLPVGQSITCSGTYETTYTDAIFGGVLSRAQAVSGESFSPIVELGINYTGPVLNHAVSVTKELLSGTCDTVGNILQYKFVVTNDGTVPLTVQPIVSDTEIDGINLPSIPADGILPNSTLEATAQIIVSQDMIDNGQFCSTTNVISGSELGSVSGQQFTSCTSCGAGNTNEAPTAPANILITECDGAFPRSTGTWLTDSGPLTLTSPNASSLGLTVTDNNDNTATVSVTGTLTNGTMQIVGEDTNGLTETQNFTVNCQNQQSVTAPNSRSVNNCTTGFPIDTGTWTGETSGLSISANDTDRDLGLRFTQSGLSGTLDKFGSPITGVVVLTGTNSFGESDTQSISVFCGQSGDGCFTKGTKVLLKNGRVKNIEDIQEGDRVKSIDGKEAKVISVKKSLYFGSLVRVNMGKAFFTAGHPIMSDNGWVSLSPEETLLESPNLSVKDMKIGTKLKRVDGFENVNSLGVVNADGIDVYNIQTDKGNYIANGYFVHNKEITRPNDEFDTGEN